MVIPLDQRPRSGPYSGLNARSAKRFLTQAFTEAGLPFAEDDALEIVLDATGFDATTLMLRGTEFLGPEVFEVIKDHMARRLGGEPVDHILGWREFYGRRFAISSDVLSPRADTVAQQNAQALDLTDRVKFSQGAWWDAVPAEARFDAVLSNPPYIDADAISGLEPEVARFDPELALHGGADGLDAYRAILARAWTFLVPAGWLGFEIGFDQGASVSDLVRAAGFINVQVTPDLGGQNRIVTGHKPG